MTMSARGARAASHPRRRARVAAALLALLAPGSCTSRAPQAHTVAVRAFTYQPDTLVVARGDTVVWTNDDIVPHTATARDGAWDSQSLARDATWRLVADRPGHHAYYCVFHPNMQGTVEVR